MRLPNPDKLQDAADNISVRVAQPVIQYEMHDTYYMYQIFNMMSVYTVE
jgi:hypothetical protein